MAPHDCTQKIYKYINKQNDFLIIFLYISNTMLSPRTHLPQNAGGVSEEREGHALGGGKCLVGLRAVAADTIYHSTSLLEGLVLVTELAYLQRTP